MARINEIKQQQVVVKNVGSFAGSLQQIAAMRMVKLRQMVIDSKRFVQEATMILRELHLEKDKYLSRELDKKRSSKKTESKPKTVKTAIIVVTSDIGLCGSYNTEVVHKIDEVIAEYPDADYFIIGHKGQNYLERLSRKVSVNYYPYNIPEEVTIKDLKPLIGMFYYYQQIFLVYNKFINTTTRKVDFIELAVPNVETIETQKENETGKFMFEPDIDELIASISARVRYALFRQQILDSKLALYTAQMIAMKTAADNADDLMDDLQKQYNKARRKIVDKKIQEVQAGRVLWDE